MSSVLRMFAESGVLRRIAYFLLAVGFILTVQHAYIGAEEKKMSDQISNTKMRSVCVGRFMIDVPEDAELSFRPASLSGWNISTDTEETESQFIAKLASKEKELRSDKNAHDLVSLENVTSVSTKDVTGKIFVFGRRWTHGYEHGKRIDENFPSMNAFIRTGEVSFNFTKEISDDADLPVLERLLEQVRSRKEDEIPSQPGFCFERGIILDPLNAQQSESVTMFVGLKDHPDVSIALFMTAGITEGNATLLDRDAKGKETFSASDRARFTRLRAGTRRLAGMIGQELVEKVAERNGVSVHAFMWESLHNDKKNLFTPFMTFEMSTGHGESGRPVSSTLPDDAALALWDKMASSLRVRPTHTTVPDATVTSVSPIGTLAASGSICSDSGWWRCTDGDERTAISGGRVQYLRAGQAMPQAVLLPAATLWQKLRGQRPVFTSDVPSSWRLVDRRKMRRHMAKAPLIPAKGTGVRNVAGVVSDVQRSYALIGTRLSSGDTCIASGWWQCLEKEALDGTRWFAGGSTLPEATKFASLSMIEKMKGVPEYLSIPATWQLIRFADTEM